LSGSVAAVLLAAACSSDDTAPPAPGPDGATSTGGSSSGGKGSGGKGTGGAQGGSGGAQGGAGGAQGGAGGAQGGADGAVTDGGDGGTVDPVCGTMTQVKCGEYLVKHIDICGDCHSERSPDGSIDMNFFLAGTKAPVFDIDPTDDTKGLVYPPNLTALKTQGWTAADIKDAFLNGKRSAAHGGPLVPVMPYSNFHNMSAAHADAIAAYILSLAPITNSIPADQPLPFDRNTALPIAPVDATKIPKTTLAATAATYDEAVLGRYLAGEAGVCIECHTERAQNGGLDSTKFFEGGEQFVVGGPFGTVTSLNITPGTNGIKGWTAANVAKVLSDGVDKDGMPLCPPMPFGPNGAFGKMLLAHQHAIGVYLTTIPGKENPSDGGKFPMCVMPSPPDGGGMPDSGSDGSMPSDASTSG
jgi:mono/diheme cytochrome c family protein